MIARRGGLSSGRNFGLLGALVAACSASPTGGSEPTSSGAESSSDTQAVADDDDDGSDEPADDGAPGDTSSGDHGDDGSTAADTGGETGATPPPSLVWHALELTCPELPGLGRYESQLVELATDLPGMLRAHAFVPFSSDEYWINPSGGAESVLDDVAHSLWLSCGNGNGLGTGTVRVALGYEPERGDGQDLRWDVREGVCPQLEDLGMFEERAVELASGIDPAFVAAHYVASAEDGRWSTKPAGGRGSHLTADGALMIACGNGNAHAAGTTIRAAFGYPADERPDLQALRWETHVGVCPEIPGLDMYEEVPTEIATDVDPDFVVGSYSFATDESWRLNPLFGSNAVHVDEQTITVNCGNGNALSAGTTARVSLAYVD